MKVKIPKRAIGVSSLPNFPKIQLRVQSNRWQTLTELETKKPSNRVTSNPAKLLIIKGVQTLTKFNKKIEDIRVYAQKETKPAE